MHVLVIPKKRNDTKIGNVSGLPKKVTDMYRKDTHLGTVLRDYKVTTMGELKRKLKGKR